MHQDRLWVNLWCAEHSLFHTNSKPFSRQCKLSVREESRVELTTSSMLSSIHGRVCLIGIQGNNWDAGIVAQLVAFAADSLDMQKVLGVSDETLQGPLQLQLASS